MIYARCIRPHRLAAAAVLIALAGCTSTAPFTAGSFNPVGIAATRVLVMEPDVELSELTLGGLNETRADWTQAGLGHTKRAVKAWLGARGIAGITYRAPETASEKSHAYGQLLKLHEAVGRTILRHAYGREESLPSKENGLRWTLGSDAKLLRDDFDADYALFIYLRDSFASGGRVAMGLAMIALGAIVNPGGTQVGFASLVDLHSGDVVWFNRLVSQTGDLRRVAPAHAAVRMLLKDNPL